MNFKKCQLKWKIVKTFTKHTQLTAIRKLFSAPPPPPHPLTRQKDKILLRLWALEKSFSYGDIQKYADFYFQSTSECSSWSLRNGAVQIFFLTEKCLPENLLREKGFWLFFGSILFSMSSELRFVKWVRFFEQICIVKWVIFFASFCWLWDYWLENLTAQKMKFPIKGFFSKCDQIRRKLRMWWHLLKKSLMEKFIFCAVSGN